ncbi:hypothetical protein [Companilactobacillus bobalius]|uniref:NIPSNAP domain-containing protein n=2 Tax=Companilactobacillus bobalius TaxID=2801451 RepID=A0A202FFC2_9LACO|nr:hypothetical protein [Companilactobacillus bobalius]KAE9560423.1 hypothetical protein ATN92_09675 [Companilactobacillus bobalius]KRK83174.1 hypothetical protein FC78_GL001983 [Companilactobacillus bobalius DSM 19674]OVE99137.1 hypothetical protein LKACC16343_00249 [Companilactobacillus bobalius]GEO57113.1 hypothetical protein LBO01_02420 [Companilactobacillus paralimentarius]
MFQLRIYTLKDNEIASLYMNKYWQKHIVSLPKFGIKVEGVFKEKKNSLNDTCRVFALVSFQKNVNAKEKNEEYMNSPEFKEDMKGFSMRNILNVESLDIQKDDSLPFFNDLEVM